MTTKSQVVALLASLAMLAAGLLAATFEAHAQRTEASEASVKAAFLYKFANYVEWPSNAFSSAAAPLVIGIVGADEVASELERIVPGRSVNNRPVTVKRLQDGEPLRGMHIVFIGRERGLAQLLRTAQGQGVLAVTEADRGLELGSAINFVPAGDRVAFEVSLDAAEKSGHRIGARMLAVARRVVPRS